MSRPLVDLLWRDHPDAPNRGARGPRSRSSTADVVDRAIGLADSSGLEATTIRALGVAIDMSAMSVYTHVNSRRDLLVLMVDQAHARMDLPAFGRASWRSRVRRVADANLELFRAHPWLLDVDDPRAALGPGTIAKYDHELHAFAGTALSDLDRDAALTFLLTFVRSGAGALLSMASTDEFEETWVQASLRLEVYVGSDFPLARRIGRVAGEDMGEPFNAERAWRFGLERVLAGLADLIEPRR